MSYHERYWRKRQPGWIESLSEFARSGRLPVGQRLMKFKLLITVIVFSFVTASSQEPCPVDVPCGGMSRWSEHGDIRWRDERARLDNLASQFRNSPDHIIYFLVYAGMRSCKDEAKLRALRAKKYLVQRHSIPAKRILWRDGGIRPDLSVEIWLLPLGSSLPQPFMTIDPPVVKPRVNCKEYRRKMINQ